MIQTETASTAVLNGAERKLRTLALEVAQLRKEARYLRSKLPPSRRRRILRRAYEDARRILHFRHAGVPTSRAVMLEDGLTERRWHWAMGLLRYARLGNVQPRTLQELQTALDRLESRYKLLAEREDDRLLELRAHMPRSYSWPIQ